MILKQQQPTLNHLTRQYIIAFLTFWQQFNRKPIAQLQGIGDYGAHCFEISC